MSRCKNVSFALVTLLLILFGSNLGPTFVSAANPPPPDETLTTSLMDMRVWTEKLAMGQLGEIELSSASQDLSDLIARIVLRDGQTQKDLVLENGVLTLDDDGTLAVTWDVSQNLYVTAHIKDNPDYVSLVMTFDNQGQGRRLIETGANIDMAVDSHWEFWDGFQTVSGEPGLSHQHDKLPGLFPAAALYTSDAGVAIGIEPMQLLSYLRSGVSSEDGSEARVEYVTRIVVDPASTEQVEFILFAFDGGYGHFGALQRYFDEFPAAFLPHPDADPRVTRGGAQYFAWSRNDPELCRRTYSGWEWVYAPFRRTGDIYGHEQFWDYTPARPISGNRAYDREEFHRWRQEAFLHRGINCDVAMLFYVPAGIWVEQQLAHEFFRDSRVRERGVTIEMNRPWVTGHDNEYRVFPYGNSYEVQFKEDMRRVVEELHMQGFAFDVANGGIRVHQHNMPSIDGMPGRTFDDYGLIFVDEGVAIALLMDYARTLEKDGRPMTIVSNPSANGVYMTIFRSDASMFEAVPWGAHGTTPEHLRSRLGNKTLVWWEHWELDQTLNMDRDPEAVRNAFLGMVDYVVLKSIALGALPAPRYVDGVPPLGRELPMLAELVRAGWQPVHAIKDASDELWLSRYGAGTRSYVAAGNAGLSHFESTLTVDNGYLGDVNYLFAHFDGSSLQNTVSQNQTELAVNIPSRKYFVGRAALGIAPIPDTTLIAEVRHEEDLATWVTYVRFDQLDGAEELSFIVEPPEGYSLTRIERNGQTIATSSSERSQTPTAEFTSRIKPGDVVAIHYQSDVYRVSRSDLHDFSFLTPSQQPPTVVQVPHDPSHGVTYAAYRLQRYFEDYYKAWLTNQDSIAASEGALLGDDDWQIPQVIAGEEGGYQRLLTFSGDVLDRAEHPVSTSTQNAVRVVLSDGLGDREAHGIVEMRDGGRTLFIGAGDGERLSRLVMDLLHELDRKYTYFGRLAVPLRAPASQ